MSYYTKKVADIRREYGKMSLTEDRLPPSPITLFNIWLDEAINTMQDSDPTAMVLSTVDYKGHADSRVVLLKGMEAETFIFYTNYHSKKGMQLLSNPYVAINFYWSEMVRQLRIRGRVKKLSNAKSTPYFATRPINSQISAIISPQSQRIINRENLESSFNYLETNIAKHPLIKPKYWGGYQLFATEIEFWQGRDNRLHDRIYYYKQRGKWQHCRLAP